MLASGSSLNGSIQKLQHTSLENNDGVDESQHGNGDVLRKQQVVPPRFDRERIEWYLASPKKHIDLNEVSGIYSLSLRTLFL